MSDDAPIVRLFKRSEKKSDKVRRLFWHKCFVALKVLIVVYVLAASTLAVVYASSASRNAQQAVQSAYAQANDASTGTTPSTINDIDCTTTVEGGVCEQLDQINQSLNDQQSQLTNLTKWDQTLSNGIAMLLSR